MAISLPVIDRGMSSELLGLPHSAELLSGVVILLTLLALLGNARWLAPEELSAR